MHRKATVWILLAIGLSVAWATARAAEQALFSDTFENRELEPDWSWLREHRGYWHLKDGALNIRVEPGKAQTVKNALICKAPDRSKGRYAIEVTVCNLTAPTSQFEQAGIVWYRDGKPVLKLVKELVDGQLMIIPARKQMTAEKVRLRLVVDENSWTAFFQPDALEGGKGTLPPPRNDQVSIQCYNGPADAEHWIRFDDFRITALGEENP